MDEQVSTVPRAVIPALPPFELTSPPERLPSREDFLIAEMERLFGGRAVRVEPEVADPELYGPSELQEPQWTGGFRGRVAKLLWDRGLKKKAIRFLNCNKLARPGVCSRYPFEHKFFVPHGCEVIFCKECAGEARGVLTQEYIAVVLSIVSRGIPYGWVLARVNFTLRSDGGEIPPERVKKFNACVGSTVRGAVFEALGECRGKFCSLRKDKLGGWKQTTRKGKPLPEREDLPDGSYGLLFVDEVGFEKRGHLPDAQRVAHGLNLHCHGLYFGPYLDNRPTCANCGSFAKKRKKLRAWMCCRCGLVSEVNAGRFTQIFMEQTRQVFGEESRGVWIERIRFLDGDVQRAVRWALNHMLKYVSKPPAVTDERLASLIEAFDTAKRVHSLGLFYGEKPKREKKDCPCPRCKAMGIVSGVGFEGRSLPGGGCIPRLAPIEELVAGGYVPLREAGRETVLAMGASREDSWGASP